MDSHLASRAYQINDLGQVLGQSSPDGGWAQNTKPFLWSEAEGSIDLNELLGLQSGYISSMNNDGTAIVGYVGSYDSSLPFVWTQNTGVQTLPTLGGSSNVARYVNNVGQVAGYCQVSVGWYVHACLWSNSTTLTDLGTLNGDMTAMPEGLNDAGQVVGWSRNFEYYSDRGFIWSMQDGMRDIGTFGGINTTAYSINNFGVVVGGSDIPLPRGQRSEQMRAFIWQNGVMSNLNALLHSDPGYVLTYAVLINDEGQILAISDPYYAPEPLPYPTIQAAIDDANNGDTVVIAPGTYHEHPIIQNKDITLTRTYPKTSIFGLM